MVDLHAVGHRRVDAVGQHCLGALLGQCLWHADDPGGGAEVADGVGGDADAEGRHHVIEETVVVVRRKQDHQLRVEGGDARTGTGHHLVDLGQDLRRGVHQADQRRVREALQHHAHRSPSHIGCDTRHRNAGWME
ncbi:hypothetical protein D9M71_204410 [compost metagenome]